MNRLVLITAMLWLTACTNAPAAVYYVDASAGSDSANGRSADNAWRTLSRASLVRLEPGDRLLLKRGSAFSETLNVSVSGRAEAPITISAYGTGDRPILNGAHFADSTPVLSVTDAHFITISDLDIRNSNHHGLSADDSSDLTFAHLTISQNRHTGMLIFDSSNVTIDDVDVYENALDTNDGYDGIRIDGSGRIPLAQFIVRNSRVHHHTGGDGWKSANGLFLGHTGNTPPILRAISITGNDFYQNGNPNQNQAGRGVTGTFEGDVTVTLNRIYRNASAGLYFGDHGTAIDITLLNNYFVNNSLRQFGGFTDATARAEGNTILVDDPELTAMGVEFGGTGTWTFRNNFFNYTTGTNDRFRGFIRINDAAAESRLDSDFNVFYSAGPQRWKLSDGSTLTFDQWRSAGFDAHSRNLR
jgi:hypothetical protein